MCSFVWVSKDLSSFNDFYVFYVSALKYFILT